MPAALTVAVAALTATLLGRSAGVSAALPIPHVAVPPGRVSVAELKAYHWHTLPDAPIATRAEGVVGVWTGSRMIVWGGDSSIGQVYGDGASYDPATRTWTRLPRSPLAPRTFAAYVWAGDRLFIWGGWRAGTDRTVQDGATYEPATRTWHRLPPLSTGDQVMATAVWTGSRVVLLTAVHGMTTTTVDAHAYDPDKDSWSVLPSIHISQTGLLDISATVAGNQLYVWMPVQTISDGLRTGNDGFAYQPRTGTWTETALLPTQRQYSVGAAVWTGDHILFQPNGVECSCGGLPGQSTGSWADPRTGVVTAVPPWLPQPDNGATFSWTGDAVLAIGSQARAGGWDPGTGGWTELAGPPNQGGAVQIWTGSELLIWGQLWAPPAHDPSAGSPPRVSEPTGLEFRS